MSGTGYDGTSTISGYSLMLPPPTTASPVNRNFRGFEKKMEIIAENGEDDEYSNLSGNANQKLTAPDIPLDEMGDKMPPKKTLNNCKCENESSPCLHILAATGDLDNLENVLNEISPQEDNTVFNLLDKNHRTVLHCAADFKGDSDIALRCVRAILYHVRRQLGISSRESVAMNKCPGRKLYKFINATDKWNLTALYLAAKRENSELCYLLLYHNADWDIRSWGGKSPAEKIFKKMPNLIARLIEELTPKQSAYEDGFRSRVCLDFGIIITYPSPADRKSNRPGVYEEMDFLSNICYTPLDQRMSILKQPLVKTLIWAKWQKIKWLVFLARIFQIAWCFLYSVLLIGVYRQDCPFQSDSRFTFHYWFDFGPALNKASDSKTVCRSSFGVILVWIVMAAMCIDFIFFQLPPIPVRIRRYWHPMKKICFRKYFKRFIIMLKIIHAGRLTFMIVACITLLPILISNFMDMSLTWEGWYILASVGIGLAWFNILKQIGKIPDFKVYIKMLTSVCQTLGVVMLIYSPLIIAFAMVFCILLPGVGPYSSPVEAILKMFTFLVGEVNYQETFYEEASKGLSVKGQGASIIVFGFAIVILNIVLLNFIIGLTVSNIQDLKQYTEVWKIYSLLWQIYLFDTFLSHFPVKVIGHSLLKRLMIFNPGAYERDDPNLIYTITLADLPKKLQKEIHGLKLPVRDGPKNMRGTQVMEDFTFLCVRKSHSHEIEDMIV